MKKVYIELSDICGLSCSFCPAPKGVRGVMPLSLFAKALDEALCFSRRIALHILGDPCYLDNLESYLVLARNKGAQVEVVTSGIYCHKHPASLLLSAPIYQLSISLEAGFDQHLVRHYAVLRALLDSHFRNPTCFVNLRIQDTLLFTKPDVLSALLYAILPQSFLNTQDAMMLHKDCIMRNFDTKGRIRLWKKALLVRKPSFVWAGFAPISKNTHKRCYGIIHQIGILSNGVVVPCCLDTGGQINLGDLHTQSLAQILRSSRAQNIAEGFKLGEAREELCMRCGFVL